MSRLHRQMMYVLIADIVSGTLTGGQMLPREADLAEEHGVSRGVARECIRGLEERGLVTVKHGRGATVCGSDSWDVLSPEVLAGLLKDHRSTEVLREYLECRRILEIEAAGIAAERATPQNLTTLSGALAQMRLSAERARSNPAAESLYHESDIEFHRAVIGATGNRALGSMTAPIHRALAQARLPLARPLVRVKRSIPEHERILTAIADGDGTAARNAMRDHLLTVEGYLEEYAETIARRRQTEAVDGGSPS